MMKMMKMIKYAALLLPLIMAVGCESLEQEDAALPVVETLDATDITRSTVVLHGRTTGGVTNMLSRGVCFGLSEQVTYEDKCVSVVRGEGEFSAKTHELSPTTQYYMKAFAVMKNGEVIYGDLKTFTTSDFQLANLAIAPAEAITSTEATLKATILYRGDYPIAECGFVYDTTEGVSLESESESVVRMKLDNITDDMSGRATGLNYGTTYYVKAYASTAYGVAYSEEISFQTKNDIPTEIGSVVLEENSYTTIKVSSQIIKPNGTVSGYGFCWSESNALPTTEDSSITLSGEFSHTIEGLRPNLTLYVRAWAQNEAGINYSPALKVRVKSYDCGGNMVTVVPPAEFYIGWLGDPSDTENEAVYAAARDGLLSSFKSGHTTYTIPSKVVGLKPYRVAKYEVTNADYVEFLNFYKSATVKDGEYKGKALLYIDEGATMITYDSATNTWSVAEENADKPAVGVTWYGANEFCVFYGGFLPNEAQWENAARGNVYSNDPSVEMFRFSGSNTLADVAVYNTPDVAEVGTKQPNQLGLYDMSGNAQEWTSSFWVRNYYATYKEAGPASTLSKVLRGCRSQRGAAQYFHNGTREALNIDVFTAGKSNYAGFRFFDSNVEE